MGTGRRDTSAWRTLATPATATLFFRQVCFVLDARHTVAVELPRHLPPFSRLGRCFHEQCFDSHYQRFCSGSVQEARQTKGLAGSIFLTTWSPCWFCTKILPHGPARVYLPL